MRFTHQHCQLCELGQQGVVVLGQSCQLVTPMLELCPQNAILLVGALQPLLQVLYLHAKREWEAVTQTVPEEISCSG